MDMLGLIRDRAKLMNLQLHESLLDQLISKVAASVPLQRSGGSGLDTTSIIDRHILLYHSVLAATFELEGAVRHGSVLVYPSALLPLPVHQQHKHQQTQLQTQQALPSAPRAPPYPYPQHTVAPSGSQVVSRGQRALTAPSAQLAQEPRLGPSSTPSSSKTAAPPSGNAKSLEQMLQSQRKFTQQNNATLVKLLPTGYTSYPRCVPQNVNKFAARSEREFVQKPKKEYVLSAVKGSKESLMLDNSIDVGKISMMQARKVGGTLKGLLNAADYLDRDATAKQMALAQLEANVEKHLGMLVHEVQARDLLAARVEKLERLVATQTETIQALYTSMLQTHDQVKRSQSTPRHWSAPETSHTTRETQTQHVKEDDYQGTDAIAAKAMEERLSAMEAKIAMLTEAEDRRGAEKAVRQTCLVPPEAETVPQATMADVPSDMPGEPTAATLEPQTAATASTNETIGCEGTFLEAPTDAVIAQLSESPTTPRRESFVTADRIQESEASVPPTPASTYVDPNSGQEACKLSDDVVGIQDVSQVIRPYHVETPMEQARNTSSEEPLPTTLPSTSSSTKYRTSDWFVLEKVEKKKVDELIDTSEEDERPHNDKAKRVQPAKSFASPEKKKSFEQDKAKKSDVVEQSKAKKSDAVEQSKKSGVVEQSKKSDVVERSKKSDVFEKSRKSGVVEHIKRKSSDVGEHGKPKTNHVAGQGKTKKSKDVEQCKSRRRALLDIFASGTSKRKAIEVEDNSSEDGMVARESTARIGSHAPSSSNGSPHRTLNGSSHRTSNGSSHRKDGRDGEHREKKKKKKDSLEVAHCL